jgi:hypothetical protein
MIRLSIISLFLCSCVGTGLIQPYHLNAIEEVDKQDKLICTSTSEHACDGWLGQKDIDMENNNES